MTSVSAVEVKVPGAQGPRGETGATGPQGPMGDVTPELAALADASSLSATQSAGSAVAAETAAATAVAARDASMVNAQTYADEATGRAAVADGATFDVQGSGDVASYRYRRTNSTTSVLIATFPSKAGVDAKVATADLNARIDPTFTAVALPPETGYVWGLVDNEGHLGFGIRTDGTAWVRLASGVSVPASALDSAVLARLLPAGIASDSIIADSGFVQAWVDAEDHVALGIRADGKVFVRMSDDTIIPSAVLTAFLASQNLTPNKALAWWGDSLSAGTGGGGTTPLSACLAALADGRAGFNGGIGGQASDQIAARQGGLLIAVSVSGAQIPASGGVAVTAKSTNVLFQSGSYTGTITGTLAGIAGTISTDGSGNWTFTRTTAGSVTTCADGTVFIPDLAGAHEKDTVVIWAGRNNFSALSTVRDNVLAMIARLTPTNKRALVLSVINSTSETSGGSSYNDIIALNAELARLLGDRFLDVRKYLIERGLAEAGIAATSQDISDIAADTIPTSLRATSDPIHLNAAAYTVTGNFVARAIRARGW